LADLAAQTELRELNLDDANVTDALKVTAFTNRPKIILLYALAAVLG
jgi:hypothetical protein